MAILNAYNDLILFHDLDGRYGVFDPNNGDIEVLGDFGLLLTDITYADAHGLLAIDFSTMYSVDINSEILEFKMELPTQFANSFGFSPRLHATYENPYAVVAGTDGMFHSIRVDNGEILTEGSLPDGYSASGDIFWYERGDGTAEWVVSAETGGGLLGKSYEFVRYVYEVVGEDIEYLRADTTSHGVADLWALAPAGTGEDFYGFAGSKIYRFSFEPDVVTQVTDIADLGFMELAGATKIPASLLEEPSDTFVLPRITGNILLELAYIADAAYQQSAGVGDWTPLTTEMLQQVGVTEVIPGFDGNGVQHIHVTDSLLFTTRAHAYVGEVEGRPTIVLAFSGTHESSNFLGAAELFSQAGRWKNYFDAHEPFIRAVANFAQESDYQLLVTGHSLGGILTEATAASLDIEGIPDDAYFVTFASPGSEAEVTGDHSDNLINFVRVDDPVPRTDNILWNRDGVTVNLVTTANPLSLSTANHSMDEKYIPSMERYISKFGADGSDSFRDIEDALLKGNSSLPLLDNPDSPTPDFLVMSAYYSNVPLRGSLDYGIGVLSSSLYLSNAVGDATRPLNSNFSIPSVSYGEITTIEPSAMSEQDVFSRDVELDDIESGQSIYIGGVRDVGVGAVEGSLVIYVDEDNSGEIDSRITIQGDHDLSLLQFEMTDIGLRISYGDPLPMGDSVLMGSNADEEIIGTDGPDIIRGVGGNNVLLGGGGDDVIFGGTGNDTLVGGDGNNHLIVTSGSNVMRGGPGNDVLEARSAGLNILDGGSGDDVLIGFFGPTHYYFDAGWGYDIIIERDGITHSMADIDKIIFREGVDPDDLEFEIDSDANLLISSINESDTILISGQFASPDSAQVELLTFEHMPDVYIDLTVPGDFGLNDDLVPNSPPVVVDDAFTTRPGVEVTGNVLTNDFDPDDAELRVVSFSYAGDGTLTVLADGRFTYIPDTNFEGLEEFVYIVTDGQGGSGTAKVEISVQANETVSEPTVIDEFTAVLDAAGWSWPGELDDSLKSTEPFLNYPDLDSVLDPVIRLYTGMLGRAPDKDGAEYWVTQINAGKSLRDLANGFLQSEEFTGLINQMGGGIEGSIEALYQNVLGRNADEEGRTYWINEWNSGRVDLADIALSFTNSAEYIDTSYSLVQGAKILLWGVNMEELSPEALGFDMLAFAEEQHVAESLVRLYTGVLDREPDIEGFDYWLARTNEPSELDTLSNSFINSAEFLDGEQSVTPEVLIDKLYRNVLDREPDDNGYDYWLDALGSGEIDPGNMVLGFTNSDEYRQESQPLVDDYLQQHYDGGLVGVPVDIESYLLG
ncbi:DUF4214 domain-containing protein [Halomonas tibetensis]|uniref:DUF4214 domain-containing protein n=1 Tax=Halomonas tibetensis TaxID=2259590 RepID=A0ABV7B907_9GAMM